MKTLFSACAVSLFALISGMAAALTTNSNMPNWIASAGLAMLMAAALAYGFCSALPQLAPVLWSRPLQGAALVCLGIIAVFIPPQFAIAALLLGTGTRIIWMAACDEADAQSSNPRVTVIPRSTTIKPVQNGWEVVGRAQGDRHGPSA